MTDISVWVVASPGWADLAVSGLPAGTASCRVVRRWRGRSEVLRGATRRPVTGDTWRFLDHAMPATVSPVDGGPWGGPPPSNLVDADVVSYTVEPLTAGGAIIAGGLATVTVSALTVGHSEALLSDPLDPLHGISVSLLEADEDSWSGDGDLLTPIGGLPVSTGMTRATTRPWSLETSSVEDAVALRDMLARGGVLLIRGDPDCLDHPTGVVYVHVPSPSMTRVRGSHDPLRIWSLTGTECAEPAQLAVVAIRSYGDSSSDFASYGQATSALPTYLDRSRGEVV